MDCDLVGSFLVWESSPLLLHILPALARLHFLNQFCELALDWGLAPKKDGDVIHLVVHYFGAALVVFRVPQHHRSKLALPHGSDLVATL